MKTWRWVLCGSSENLQHSLSPAPSFGWVGARPVLISHTLKSRFAKINPLTIFKLKKALMMRVKVQFCNFSQVLTCFQLYFVQTLHQIWLELVFRLHKLKLAPWGRLSLNYCPPYLGLGWEAASRLTKYENHPPLKESDFLKNSWVWELTDRKLIRESCTCQRISNIQLIWFAVLGLGFLI